MPTSSETARSKQNYTSLLRELALTDFKLKYQGSVVGYFWSLMKPLAMFGVLYLVFTVFVRIGSSIKHYPLYLLIGIVLWSYLQDSTTTALRSIVDKGDLIRKVYFPRTVILMASSISALITLGLNSLVILTFLLVLGIPITLHWPLVLLLLVELYVLSLGLSFFLAALYAKYRDFGHIWEVGLQLLFYATPIIYPLTIVPARFAKFILMSPVSQVIQDVRWSLVGDAVPVGVSVVKFPLAIIPYLIPFILLPLGYWYFERSASKFAEEV